MHGLLSFFWGVQQLADLHRHCKYLGIATPTSSVAQIYEDGAVRMIMRRAGFFRAGAEEFVVAIVDNGLRARLIT